MNENRVKFISLDKGKFYDDIILFVEVEMIKYFQVNFLSVQEIRLTYQFL